MVDVNDVTLSYTFFRSEDFEDEENVVVSHVRPGRGCPPRHRMPFTRRNED